MRFPAGKCIFMQKGGLSCAKRKQFSRVALQPQPPPTHPFSFSKILKKKKKKLSRPAVDTKSLRNPTDIMHLSPNSLLSWEQDYVVSFAQHNPHSITNIVAHLPWCCSARVSGVPRGLAPWDSPRRFTLVTICFCDPRELIDERASKSNSAPTTSIIAGESFFEPLVACLAAAHR